MTESRRPLRKEIPVAEIRAYIERRAQQLHDRKRALRVALAQSRIAGDDVDIVVLERMLHMNQAARTELLMLASDLKNTVHLVRAL